MNLEEFNYHLPSGLIAQQPSTKRDMSKMMVIDRKHHSIEESVFHQLTQYVKKGDVIVINNSKVIPASLLGNRKTGGKIEVLLLAKRTEDRTSQTWDVLMRPAKRARPGDIINFYAICEGRIIQRVTDKKWIMKFTMGDIFDKFLEKYGKAPLPPYIKRKNTDKESIADKERYQTIYAKVPGSVAAPTAGFHFSAEVMAELVRCGVQIVQITLHIGYGTFRPIETDLIEEHTMEEEHFAIGDEEAKIINQAKRVIAVGTTSTRALESASDDQGKIKPVSAPTRLFIYPGYKFKCVDALLTNFHLPKTSLYLLVCAFADKDLIETAYRQAMESSFRFYSYGDCMLIL